LGEAHGIQMLAEGNGLTANGRENGFKETKAEPQMDEDLRR
jgi:hypothetical protein